MKKIAFLLFTSILLMSCTSKNNEVVDKNIDNTGATIQDKNTLLDNTGAIEYQTGSISVEDTLETTGLEKDLEDFNFTYKQALFNSGQGKEEAITQIKTSVEQWGNIISKYRGYNVVGFEKSIDLDKKLVEIGINLLTAGDFSTSGKMELAHSELEKVRIEISKIRQDNAIKSISDDMLLVHNKMEEIVENGETKDDKKIEELKTEIKKLTDYNSDNEEYKKMLGDFENTVNVLSSLKGAEYKTKLSELKPLFIKMYMKFG